ncbi:MAG: class I SAM-dependent methyltransferase [Gammaproteobacteria bacterium]|jgi:ubiquinone/menaquinone biosynthesis C-methylase UbiE|nr:class I SAM-dependent methyltransferase [Gammaproteobacteria bacterium]MDP7154588.1 class I SAM-dependent methyltransferase [Gammaproteobacteria bacterium]MDP7296675.1 class I SAM-dependent methyltransferase [Gammaproteobacteria bacterium]MDP7420118.1 class I SAM-dependent methyltransferase [Gammaproteobacteria bacterium]HJP38343.1 class I SAM-dependent methyltransferase [Gammaproteobacteria bacterium]
MNANDENYVLGYGGGAMDWMKSRTVEKHGAFLLPYLKPGQSLLDCGCGPGSLTVGFAQILSPGQVIGIDRETEQLAAAIDYANQHNLNNLHFKTGNVYDLPFDDASFDIVFCSAVLGSVSKPKQVVREMVRVLKQDGVIALKEFDHGGDIVYPQTPILTHSIELYQRIRIEHGHEQRAGRRLREWLTENNCSIEHTHASFDQRTTNTGLYDYVDRNNRLVDEILATRYIELGWATREDLDAHALEWERFARDPASLYASAWIDAVARKNIPTTE